MPQRLSAALSDVAIDVGGIVRARSQAPRVSLEQVERGLRERSADLLNQIAEALHVSAEVVDMPGRSSRRDQVNAATNAIVTDVAMTRC
jgi:transcriptional regulator with XRE-family HTH domain